MARSMAVEESMSLQIDLQSFGMGLVHRSREVEVGYELVATWVFSSRRHSG